jgi:type II secretory pathway component PulF
MIRTGEASGNLNETLKRLADFLEREDEFKNSIRSALVYPFFVFVVGVLTVCVLLVFVIPRLVTMFEDMGQTLPLPTRILIGVSSFFHDYWWVILAAILLLVFFLRRLYRSPQGRLSLDKLRLKIVMLGPLTLKTEISRLMRALSLLISGGIPITSALDISATIVENRILRAELYKFKDEIKNGSNLSTSLKNSKFFPEFVTNIVAVGEETGGLPRPLMRIADDYERELDRTLKSLARLIEPVIILFVGLIVGFIVISMLLPIFQLNLIVR